MSRLRDMIFLYVHSAEDPALIQAACETEGVGALMKELLRLAESRRHEDSHGVCLFTLDAARCRDIPEQLREEFCRRMEEDGLLGALRRAIFSESYVVRANAISTLGRLCDEESIPAMEKAFERCVVVDPLQLPDVLFELFWLKQGMDIAFLERAAGSVSYLSRWAMVDFLEPEKFASRMDDFFGKKRLAEKLSEDESAAVRAEARYWLEHLRMYEEGIPLSKAEAKRRRREMKRFVPSISFEKMRGDFRSETYMQEDYRVEEVVVFHERMVREMCGESELKSDK